MDMATNSYLVVKDYDLTSRLQALFMEYADLNTKIHNARRNEAVNNDEILELDLNLKKAVNEIGFLVMKMKRLQADSKITGNSTHQTLSASKRSNRLQHIVSPS
jgi:hypothetical protein